MGDFHRRRVSSRSRHGYLGKFLVEGAEDVGG
jgi:hypothetical protein